MSQWVGFRFSAPDPEQAEQFVEEYVLDAIDRLSDHDACESVSFAFATNPETGDRSVVTLAILGDLEKLRDQEASRWDEAVAEGPITDWEQMMAMDRAEMETILGERNASLFLTLAQLSAEMAAQTYEIFADIDRRPGAVETYPDEESQPGPIGWWVLLHTMTVQLNYSLEEELDAYLQGIDHTLRNFAEREDAATIDEQIDDIVAELEANREAVKNGRRFSL